VANLPHMNPFDEPEFPPALAAVAAHEFDYRDGEGVDYEPYDRFLSTDETTEWLRAWTGNSEVDADCFQVFGQDGSGGHVAFWLVHPKRPIADQPVAFLGSEGERGVIARDLADYLWLLADGTGPYEALAHPQRTSNPNAELTDIAERYAPDRRQPAATLIENAKRQYPSFGIIIGSLCR
jgi:hypothetical protein